MKHIILNQQFLSIKQNNTMNEHNEKYFDGKKHPEYTQLFLNYNCNLHYMKNTCS